MRRSISKIPYGLPTAPSSIAAFSTSSGGGGGRGRGVPTPFQFTSPDDDSKKPNLSGASPPPHGHGRGRGVPVAPSPFSPAAIGRGIGGNSNLPPPKPDVKMPLRFAKFEEAQSDSAESKSRPAAENSLPGGIFGALSGTGRGRPGQFSPPKPQAESPPPRPQAEARPGQSPPPRPQAEARPGQSPPPRPQAEARPGQSPPPRPQAEARPIPDREQRQPYNRGGPREQLNEQENVKKAVGVISKGAAPGGYRGVRAEGREMERGREEGGGERGRGGGARGRGGYGMRGRGRVGYGGRGGRGDRYDEQEEEATGQYFGDPADEEKVAKRLGPEIMSKIVEGFHEIAGNVLPDPKEEALLEAYETNLRIECDPEFLMEEFGTNPDIDEKPPIPLREALEKMKPFLMTYEGIETQEEWEEIMEETMKKVPLMKSIVDHYGGPDRVTAKQQHEELQRVAKTLPASAPASVKRFTDRAVLSLQSNPGWGFDKKCKFMDQLVGEVSKMYK